MLPVVAVAIHRCHPALKCSMRESINRADTPSAVCLPLHASAAVPDPADIVTTQPGGVAFNYLTGQSPLPGDIRTRFWGARFSWYMQVGACPCD